MKSYVRKFHGMRSWRLHTQPIFYSALIHWSITDVRVVMAGRIERDASNNPGYAFAIAQAE
jgi:hypothetical protein